MSLAAMFAIFDGVGFDPFFRGLLSVLVMVVMLIGSTYLIIATNQGSRTGGLLASAAFFGWMAIMGSIWTVYGIGWIGEPQSWALQEINVGELDLAESEEGSELGLEIGNDSSIFDTAVTAEDAEERQEQAVAYASDQDLAGWSYLAASNPKRGEAQSSAEAFLLEELIYGGTDEYVILQLGAFGIGGKPGLDDDPSAVERAWNKIRTTVIPWHPEELVAIQVQGAVAQPLLPGQAPPLPMIDEQAPVTTVIMSRDRGGPIPSLMSGERFTPLVFAIFNGILFAVLAFLLHVRDQREMAVRANKATATA